jgi:2'-5' RNA ligase
MPTLFTVSYPEVSSEAASFMEVFRREHDLPQRDVIAAHLTMVFGCKALEPSDYTQHIAAVASQSNPISFSCKYAMLYVDHLNDAAHVFLVPDEGYSAISLLHDRLYTGPLQPHLKLDIPFIPHITIGTLKDRSAAKTLCDQLNRSGVCVEGNLRALTVGAIENGKFKKLSIHNLNVN